MIQQKIFNKIKKILKEYDIYEEIDISKIVQLCLDDLITFAKKDPSSNGDIFYIFETYKSYQAVLYYRIAHSLQEKEKFYYARKLSEEAKTLTGSKNTNRYRNTPKSKNWEKFCYRPWSRNCYRRN